MKVLHIGAGNLYGGIESNLLQLARARHLCPEMQPAFALCFQGRMAAELRAEGVPLFMLGAMRASRPWTVWSARRKLRALLQRERYDAVACHGTWSFALLGKAVRAAGARLFLWCHCAVSGKAWDERRAAKLKPDGIIANSAHSARSLPRIFPGTKIEIVHCLVEAPRLGDPKRVRAEVRSELRTPENKVVILQVSRIEELKGHRVLLQALAALARTPDWQCWIVGAPQRPSEAGLYAELQTLAARANLAQRVEFLGQRADVARLMASADIVCQPNTQPESFGLVFIEALYAGRPVVTSGIGGALEVLDESCGVWVPPGAPDALAAALGALIGNLQSREALGRNGPARARELCAPETQLKKLLVFLSGFL